MEKCRLACRRCAMNSCGSWPLSKSRSSTRPGCANRASRPPRNWIPRALMLPLARSVRPRKWAWILLLARCPQLLPWPWIPARLLRPSRQTPWLRPPRWPPARLPRRRPPSVRLLQTPPPARSRAGPLPPGPMKTCRTHSVLPRPKRCARRWPWSCNVAVQSARNRPRPPQRPHPQIHPPSKEASMAHKPIKPSRRARNLRRQQERRERRLQVLALRRS